MGTFCGYDGETGRFDQETIDKWVAQFRHSLEHPEQRPPDPEYAERGTGRTSRLLATAIEAARNGQRPCVVFATARLAENFKPIVKRMAKARGVDPGLIQLRGARQSVVGFRPLFIDSSVREAIVRLYR